MEKLKSLLFWNKNKLPSKQETRTEFDWSQLERDANTSNEKIQKIAQVVRSQEMVTPSPQLFSRILAEVDQEPGQTWKSNPWIWGTPVMLLIFTLLWLILQPGYHLQWNTQGNQPATFRIYRASAETMVFKLIEELPARSDQQTYQYADTLILPWQTYQYLIEIRDQNGNIITSRASMQNSWIPLVTQITILLTGFMLTFGIITITQEYKPTKRLKLLV
jgi:hypothetical protein